MPKNLLIPFDLSDPTPLPPSLAENLSDMDIIALGHYPVPEQTPNKSASEHFEGDAKQTLDELTRPLIQAGAAVTPELVFGKDRQAAIKELMIEYDCAAELLPAPSAAVDQILVPIPPAGSLSELPTFISLLSPTGPQEITLFHVIEGDHDRSHGEEIVDAVREQLVAADVAPDAINTRITENAKHDKELLRVAPDYDAVVMYNAQDRPGDFLFGALPQRIQNKTADPVIVVRRDY